MGGGEAQSENPIPRFIVGVNNPFDVDGDSLIAPGDVASGTVLAGPGQFRSANDLRTQIDQIKALARYGSGAHSLTAGYELNQLDLSNLFIQNATGTLFFSSINNLRNGIINAGQEEFPDTTEILSGASVGANGTFTFSGDPIDATNRFSRSFHSFYVQDEWRPVDALTFVLGLRYDFYSDEGAPRENPEFFRCSVPERDGITVSDSSSFREDLWDRYFTAAPPPRTPSERQYSDRKLQSRNLPRSTASTRRR